MNTEYRIIEIDDQRFVVTTRDPYVSAINGDDTHYVVLETCNLMSAQDYVMRRSMSWSVYLKADECECAEHDLPAESVGA